MRPREGSGGGKDIEEEEEEGGGSGLKGTALVRAERFLIGWCVSTSHALCPPPQISPCLSIYLLLQCMKRDLFTIFGKHTLFGLEEAVPSFSFYGF